MKLKLAKFRNSPLSAFLLHLLIPGLGHMFWREYMFGVFVFLVTLMAAALFVVSLFIDIPLLAKFIVYGLPTVFYIFSFFDLGRTVTVRAPKMRQSNRKTAIFFAVGILYEIFSPLAPVNFAWHNSPELFVLKNNDLSPMYRQGDVRNASRLAYMFRTNLVDKPIFHSLPERFAVVRFVDDNGKERCGLVLGLPGEEVAVVDGLVVANQQPQIQPKSVPIPLIGDWPSTPTGDYSLLIAVVHLGAIDRAYDVPLSGLIGKVEPAF